MHNSARSVSVVCVVILAVSGCTALLRVNGKRMPSSWADFVGTGRDTESAARVPAEHASPAVEASAPSGEPRRAISAPHKDPQNAAALAAASHGDGSPVSVQESVVIQTSPDTTGSGYMCGRLYLTRGLGAGATRGPCISPDGTRSAYAESAGGKYVMVIDGKRSPDRYRNITAPYGAYFYAYGVLDGHAGPESMFFSPDSTRCVYVGMGAAQRGTALSPVGYFVVIDDTTMGPYPNVSTPVFAPRGNDCAFIAGRKLGEDQARPSGRNPAYAGCVVRGTKAGTRYGIIAQRLVFSPDGNHLAYVVWKDDGMCCVIRDGTEIPMPDAGIDVQSLTFSPDSRHLLYKAHSRSGGACFFIDGVQSELYQQIESMAVTSQWQVTPGNDAHRQMVHAGNERLVVAGAPATGNSWITFSPDGRHIAYWVSKRSREFRPIVDSFEGVVSEELGWIVFSPDSTRALYSVKRDGEWFVVHQVHHDDTWKVVRQSEGYRTVSQPVFSSDGRHDAYQATSGSRYTVVTDGVPGRLHQRIVSRARFVPGTNGVCFWCSRPDGAFAFLVDGNERIVLARRPVFSLSTDGSRMAYLAPEPRGTRVAVHDVVTGKERTVARGRYISVGRPAFSSDGKRVAFTVRVPGGKGWRFVADGQEMGGYANLYGPFFTPDGAHLVYAFKESNREPWRLGVDGAALPESFQYDALPSRGFKHFKRDGSALWFNALRGSETLRVEVRFREPGVAATY